MTISKDSNVFTASSHNKLTPSSINSKLKQVQTLANNYAMYPGKRNFKQKQGGTMNSIYPMRTETPFMKLNKSILDKPQTKQASKLSYDSYSHSTNGNPTSIRTAFSQKRKSNNIAMMMLHQSSSPASHYHQYPHNSIFYNTNSINKNTKYGIPINKKEGVSIGARVVERREARSQMDVRIRQSSEVFVNNNCIAGGQKKYKKLTFINKGNHIFEKENIQMKQILQQTESSYVSDSGVQKATKGTTKSESNTSRFLNNNDLDVVNHISKEGIKNQSPYKNMRNISTLSNNQDHSLEPLFPPTQQDTYIMNASSNRMVQDENNKGDELMRMMNDQDEKISLRQEGSSKDKTQHKMNEMNKIEGLDSLKSIIQEYRVVGSNQR